MPYSRPTLTDLRTQVLQDINSAQITDANGNVLSGLLQQAILRVVANATAGMSYEHYGYIDWISLQAVPWTATDEFLDAWAGLKGVTRLPATATTGTATYSGLNQTPPNGTDIPPATGIVRGDGASFTTTADATVSGGTVTLAIQAAAPGSAGNFDANTVFLLASPIGGLQPQSTASVQVIPGADQELDPALRLRMLLAYAKPPQGGAQSDYVEWAEQVPGVTRAWCQPLGKGPGTVIVYTMFDIAEAANGGFPQGTNGVASGETRDTAATGDQLVVANHIFPLRPVTALVYSYAPTPQALPFTVAGLNPNTTAMQGSVETALAGLLLQKGSPLADTPIDQSDADAALTAIPGIISFRVSAPAFPQTPTLGSLFELGTVTFTEP